MRVKSDDGLEIFFGNSELAILHGLHALAKNGSRILGVQRCDGLRVAGQEAQRKK